MSLPNASSSFQACGSVTLFEPVSSNSGRSAPTGSPTNTFQSELKLYFDRGVRGASLAKVMAETQSNKRQVRKRRNLTAAPKGGAAGDGSGRRRI